MLTCADCPDGRMMLATALSLSRLRMVRSAKLALTRPSAKALKRARPARSSAAMTSLDSQVVVLMACRHTAARSWPSCHVRNVPCQIGANGLYRLDSSIPGFSQLHPPSEVFSCRLSSARSMTCCSHVLSEMYVDPGFCHGRTSHVT